MKSVLKQIEKLRNSPIRKVVDRRMHEFNSFRRKPREEIFRELCFCLLTAGTSAELGIKTINHLGNVIFNGSKSDIQKKLKEVYRFHTKRAEYIFLARKNFNKIDMGSKNVREDLVKNIKGLGMKEASHFLRNVGFNDYAIVDFHIVDLLARERLIKKPKTITPRKYLEIEDILREIAKKAHLSLGELDLYLWYLETGTVLK